MMKKLIALLTFAILCLTAAIAEEAPIPISCRLNPPRRRKCPCRKKHPRPKAQTA